MEQISTVNRLARLPWLTLFKVSIGVTLLILAIRGVNLRLVLTALSEVNLPWVTVTLGVILFATWLKALRWRLLLSGAAPEIGVKTTLGPLMLGQALNMLAWARLGDVARVGWLQMRTGAGTIGIMASVLAEKLLDAFMIALLALLLVSQTIFLSFDTIAFTAGLSLLGVALFAGSARWGAPVVDHVVGWMAQRRLPGYKRLGHWLKAGMDALEPLAQMRLFVAVLGTSALIWGAAWATNVTLFVATDLTLPFRAALLVLVLIFVGVAPGLMPTNVGPFYFLSSLALRSYGIEQSAALGYAVLLHLLVTIVPLVGAVIFLLSRGGGRKLWRPHRT